MIFIKILFLVSLVAAEQFCPGNVSCDDCFKSHCQIQFIEDTFFCSNLPFYSENSISLKECDAFRGVKFLSYFKPLPVCNTEADCLSCTKNQCVWIQAMKTNVSYCLPEENYPNFAVHTWVEDASECPTNYNNDDHSFKISIEIEQTTDFNSRDLSKFNYGLYENVSFETNASCYLHLKLWLFFQMKILIIIYLFL